MAIRFAGAGNNYFRNTTIPAVSGYTAMGWFYASSNTGFNTALSIGASAGPQYVEVFGDGGSPFHVFIYQGDSSSSLDSGVTWTTGTWHHFAVTCAGTGANQLLLYIDGVLKCTGTSVVSSNDEFWIAGSHDGDGMDGRCAAWKVWSVVLTANAILDEMAQYQPRWLTNLNSFYPMIDPTVANDKTDFGGLGLTLTVNGVLTYEDGPNIPWRVGRQMIRGTPTTPRGLFRPPTLTGIGAGGSFFNDPLYG